MCSSFEYFDNIKENSSIIMSQWLHSEYFNDSTFNDKNILIPNKFLGINYLSLVKIINNCEYYTNSSIPYNSMDVFILKDSCIYFDIEINKDFIDNFNKLKNLIELDINNINVCTMNIIFKPLSDNSHIRTLYQCKQVNY